MIQCALEETSAGRRTLVLTLFQRHTDWFRGGDGFLEEKRFTVDGNTSSMQRWVAVVRQRACIPAQRKHILVILNPISGGGKSVDCLRKQLAPLIVASGHAYELVQCAYAGKAQTRTHIYIHTHSLTNNNTHFFFLFFLFFFFFVFRPCV